MATPQKKRGRPKKSSSPIFLRISPKVDAVINAEAERRGIPKGTLLRRVIEDHYDNQLE